METAPAQCRQGPRHKKEFAMLRRFHKGYLKIRGFEGLLGGAEPPAFAKARIRQRISRLESRMRGKSDALLAAIGENQVQVCLEAGIEREKHSKLEAMSDMSVVLSILSAAAGIVTLPAKSIIAVVDYSNPLLSLAAWCASALCMAASWILKRMDERRIAFYATVPEMLDYAKALAGKSKS